MTAKQKDIVRKLLVGYNIIGNSAYGFRLRDQGQNVVLKFNYKTFFRIKDLLRKQKDCFVINKSKVRQLHGRSFAKQLYKKHTKKGAACDPCSFQLPHRALVLKPSRRKPAITNDDQITIF